MLKCPKCNQEIDHVVCETTEIYKYVVRLPKNEGEENSTDYDLETGLMQVFVEDSIIVVDKYICPLCRKEIAQGEEVVKFLKGG